VLNNMDQVGDGADPESLAQRILGESKAAASTATAAISARTGEGFDELLRAIDAALPLDPVSRQRFRIPAGEGSLIHLLHERAKVLSTRYQDEVVEIEAEAPESVQRQFSEYVAE